MTPLRIAVVTSNGAGNAARICHHLAGMPDSAEIAEIAGAIVDVGTAPDRGRQLRRLRAWHRHGGISYTAWRCRLELEARIRPQQRARYRHSLEELGSIYGFPVTTVPNVNSGQAHESLRRLDADLGISIGNRVIGEATFSIPRLGMINLHHGDVRSYRGGPPAFWELVDEVPVMSVSVHRIDSELDHGELLATVEVPILAGDDPRTLMERAHEVDFLLVGDVVRALADGTSEPVTVRGERGPVRTLPSRAQVRELQRRLGRPVRHDDYVKARLPELPS